ncbi:helix-turn-helix domain-containing protein [Kordiimonas pumila]|uniref:Helix-turn-helix domain-containing protein n=1 Tax=Kordiimonas pumila TaxID=2161677 RepID=A0ABV7D610_9PROT|nr:helix-turn-helix domain-containing protein [Kordiimonas pumila]
MELATYWKISHRTLERWRWLGKGPIFMKLGGRILYSIQEVEAFEQAQRRQSTSGKE